VSLKTAQHILPNININKAQTIVLLVNPLLEAQRFEGNCVCVCMYVCIHVCTCECMHACICSMTSFGTQSPTKSVLRVSISQTTFFHCSVYAVFPSCSWSPSFPSSGHWANSPVLSENRTNAKIPRKLIIQMILPSNISQL
jgi:hypothetical protein